MTTPKPVRVLLNGRPTLAFEQTAGEMAAFEEKLKADDVPGAWRSGTRVIKARRGDDEVHREGTLGTLRGCLGVVRGEFCYIVAWDDDSETFVIGSQLRRLDEG